MRALALAVALIAAGCGGSSAYILTGGSDKAGCFTDSASGLLSYDATLGTVIADTDTGFTFQVMWRPGYTARLVGSQVVVEDPTGHEVATTGKRYRIEGGALPSGPFWACGFATAL